MANKEELYGMATELARKCFDRMNKRGTKKPLTMDELLERLEENNQALQALAEYKGFLFALICVGILTSEDVIKLNEIIFPAKALAPEVAKFIEGLNLDGLKSVDEP